jgi:hypothetical protein
MGTAPLQFSCKVTPGPSRPSAIACTRRQLPSLHREPVDSLGLYVRLYRLCGAFFEEKLGPGVSPNRARKMGLAVHKQLLLHNIQNKQIFKIIFSLGHCFVPMLALFTKFT